MLDELLSFLDRFSAGDFILAIIVIVWVGKKGYLGIKGIADKHKQTVENNMLMRQKFEGLVNGLAEAQGEINDLKSKMQSEIESLTEKIDEYMSSIDVDKEQFVTAISELNKTVLNQQKSLLGLQKTVDRLEIQVQALFDADSQYFYTFLVDGHTKYVKEEKTIDLLTLQNFERLFNNYVDKNGGERDEFLTRLMNDLRNLPTTK